MTMEIIPDRIFPPMKNNKIFNKNLKKKSRLPPITIKRIIIIIIITNPTQKFKKKLMKL